VKVLTDTHTLVWALTGSEPLGAAANAALARSLFTASVANLWELVFKSRKPGALVADPLLWWEKYVLGPRIPTLAIRTAHTAGWQASQFTQGPVRPHPGRPGAGRRADACHQRRHPCPLWRTGSVGMKDKS